eukprot:9893978-Alexandrium_andersonii.AAC.1
MQKVARRAPVLASLGWWPAGAWTTMGPVGPARRPPRAGLAASSGAPRPRSSCSSWPSTAGRGTWPGSRAIGPACELGKWRC